MAQMKRSRYKADGGTIHPIRLHQDTFTTVQGTEPTGDINSVVRAKVTRSKREFGLRPRGVVIARVRGAGNDTFTEYARLPVLDPADFDSSTGSWVEGSNVTYKGAVWEIVSRFGQLPEDTNTSSNSGGGSGAITPNR